MNIKHVLQKLTLTFVIHMYNKFFSPYVSHTTVHYNFESITFEPFHDKTNKKVACVPSEDSYQPGHMPSLISLFKDPWFLQAYRQKLK